MSPHPPKPIRHRLPLPPPPSFPPLLALLALRETLFSLPKTRGNGTTDEHRWTQMVEANPRPATPEPGTCNPGPLSAPRPSSSPPLPLLALLPLRETAFFCRLCRGCRRRGINRETPESTRIRPRPLPALVPSVLSVLSVLPAPPLPRPSPPLLALLAGMLIRPLEIEKNVFSGLCEN